MKLLYKFPVFIQEQKEFITEIYPKLLEYSMKYPLRATVEECLLILLELFQITEYSFIKTIEYLNCW